MLELRKFVAPEFIFGSGAVELVSLDAGGLQASIFSAVSPHPRTEEVMAGAEVYAAENCDVIVAVGGGSPMDCAKGIGIVATNKRNILTFEGIYKVPIPGPPPICIPTTAGTSADVSQFAIISDQYLSPNCRDQ